jgi:uncharacterized membrane protein YgcG
MKSILLSSAFLAIASVASAQNGPTWGAFAGCWAPIPAEGQAPAAAATPIVCVVPNGTSADLATVVSQKVTERTTVNANGARHEAGKQGCNGWESAEFSSDGRRLYLKSEQTCLGGVKRTTSGIFAIASNGDWINAVNVAADSANSVRVSRYTPVSMGTLIPEEIRTVLDAREVADRTARISAGMVSTAAVVEASRFLSAPAVEAWIAELEHDFDLDDKRLVALADAGVPPSVIDVMVAVSNPRTFAVRATGSGITTTESDSVMARRSARYNNCTTPVMDPWAWYAYDPCDPYNRYSYYRYRRYGYRYDPYLGYGYGYNPYGYGYGYDYGRPVVIYVRGSNEPIAARPHGKMTKDGYRSGTGTTTRGTDNPAPRTSSGTSSGTSSSTPRETGSSSTGSSSSGSGSSGRTATRKPPAN